MAVYPFISPHGTFCGYGKGFTLAELLVALSILAVIAVFSIPKILQNQQDSRKKVVFQETLAAIADMQHQAIIYGTNTGTTLSIIQPKLNAIKLCTTNAQTQGCWTQGVFYGEETEGGAILANGASICGLFPSVSAWGGDLVVIDWNGATGPNVEGDDQLYFKMCYNNTASGFAGRCTNQDIITYTDNGNIAANTSLFNWIFQ